MSNYQQQSLTSTKSLAHTMNISYELFPVRTEQGAKSLKKTIVKLDTSKPDFYSVTFGASGSAQDATFDTIAQLVDSSTVAVAPHLTCVDSYKEKITQMLGKYQNIGIKNIVLLRGDMQAVIGSIGEFNYANELVEFIRAQYNDQFKIYVAAYPEKHPQSQTIASDIKHFVNKVKAGADGAITQYFYNTDAYFRFVDEVQKLGADVPIIPGIMPITNYEQLVRFSKICNAEIPSWILNRLKMYKDDLENLRAFGLDVVSDMCLQLKTRGVNDFHFYTMNRSEPTLAILKNIT